MTLTVLDYETGKVHVYLDIDENEIESFVEQWGHSSIEWMSSKETNIAIETFAMAQDIM